MNTVISISIKILLISVFCITLFYTFENTLVYSVESPMDNPEDWEPKTIEKAEDQTIIDIGNKIIGPTQVVGSLVSVVAIIVLGIKYMLGSVDEKAQYKETLGPYFLGAILVFGITNILAIVYDIAISF